VTVQHVGSGKTEAIFLEAEYDARINLLGYSFSLHFSPSSTK